MLILQCDSLNDAAHVLLTKSVVDRCRTEYSRGTHYYFPHYLFNVKDTFCVETPKHVLLIIHLHRGIVSASNERWQLNFMSGWRQISIDSVEKPQIPLVSVLDGSVKDLFEVCTFKCCYIVRFLFLFSYSEHLFSARVCKT